MPKNKGITMGVDSSSKFTKNARVEVTSEEEGFTGAWFLAKIIDPFPRKRPNQFYIEYETLLDESSTKPLKEFVNSRLVRPIPPQETKKIQSFQLDDVVDAFHKDGWWPGVITKVFEGNSKFQVTFSNPPDLLDLEAQDLRIHWDWKNGKWILPKKQRISGLLFSKGKKVEVSLAKVELNDVWFPAIVQEDLGNGSFLVEYQCLGKNGEPEFVKVEVDSLCIRPSPPQLKGKNYDLLEKVDAYIEFGWWSGVLTKELPDNKYLVFFKETKKERSVSQSEIRPHMEWKDGSWYSTSQDVSTPLDYQGPAKNDSLNVHRTEVRTADFLNSLDIRREWSTPPSKELEHSNNSDLPLFPKDKLDSSSLKASGEDIHLSSNSTNGGTRTSNIEQSKVDMPPEDFSGGKRARTKCQKVDELHPRAPQRLKRSVGRPPKSQLSDSRALVRDKRVGELEHHTPEQLRKSEVLPIAQMGVSQTPEGRNDDAANCTEENFVQEDCVTAVPITHYPEKEVIEGSQGEIRSHPAEVLFDRSGNQQLVQDPPVEGAKEADQLERHLESTGKRKRGRPSKLQKSPEVGQQKGVKKLAKSPEVTKQNGGVTAEDMASGEVVLPVVVGLEATKVDGSVSNKEMIGVDKKILNSLADQKSKSSSKNEVYTAKKDKLRSKKGIQVSVGKQVRDSSKRGRRAPNIDAGSPNQDPDDPNAKKMTEVNGKGSSAKEAEMSTVRLPLNMSDDKPLSMWFDPPKTADATSVSQGANVDKQSITNSSRDIVILSSQQDDQILPFAKSSPVWNSVESMDAFRLLPQTPHFQSLFSAKESSREGFAIALMVNFSSVFDKTSQLEVDCPRNIIEDYLETLLQLEDNGFKVDVLRDRLLQLLSAKDKVEQAVAKQKESLHQIEEENHDQTELDNRIKDMDNRIRLIQEERALALSTKAEKDLVIATLKSTVSDLDDSIRDAELDFKALVAAPWQVG